MVSPTENMKVLIVDDETLCRMSIVNFGKRLKIEVEQAENGKQAIEIVANKFFPLILLDIQMPDMNGFETAAKLKELDNGQNAIMIALSGGKI